MFRPSELMHLTAGLLAKLDSELAEKIEGCRAQADPDRDIDSQFEEAKADEVFEKSTASGLVT